MAMPRNVTLVSVIAIPDQNLKWKTRPVTILWRWIKADFWNKIFPYIVLRVKGKTHVPSSWCHCDRITYYAKQITSKASLKENRVNNFSHRLKLRVKGKSELTKFMITLYNSGRSQSGKRRREGGFVSRCVLNEEKEINFRSCVREFATHQP